MIERAARDPAVDIDKFERLLAMRDRVEAQRASLAFAEAFAELGPDLPVIDRKGRIVVYSKEAREKRGGPTEADKPIQKTPYATLDDILEAVRAPLAAHGFSVRFEYETTPDGRLVTSAVLRHRGGHAEKATTPPLKHDTTGSKNDVQAVGSALKYGMRYALTAVLPIVSHASQDRDDDGNAAGDPPIEPDQVDDIRRRIEATGTRLDTFLDWAGVEKIEDMTAATYKRAVEHLAARARKQQTEKSDARR